MPRDTYADLSNPSVQASGAEKLAEMQANVRSDIPTSGADSPRGPDGKYVATAKATMRSAQDATEAVLKKSLDDIFERKVDTTEPELDEKGSPTGRSGKEAAGQEGKKPAEEKASAENRRDLEAALKALRLDGFEDADLEGMSEERVVALGKKAAKRQADVSKRLETASKQQATQTAEQDDTDAEDKPEASAKSAKAAERSAEPEIEDDDELVGRILPTAKELSDLYGEEEFGRPFAKTMARVLKGPVARVAQLESLVEQLVLDNARAGLRERFPQVEQDEHREALSDKMRALAQSGAYDNVRSLMRDAAMTLWGEQALEAARSSAERKMRSAPAPIQTRKAADKPRSFEDYLDQQAERALGSGGR